MRLDCDEMKQRLPEVLLSVMGLEDDCIPCSSPSPLTMVSPCGAVESEAAHWCSLQRLAKLQLSLDGGA